MSPSIQDEFIGFAGELAESLSLNRSLGQIYGFLYLSGKPQSLDEIALRLGMSKGNASINLRVLESWAAVQQVGVSGSRRDHYEANRDIKKLAMKRIQEGFGRRLEMVDSRLDHISTRLPGKGTDAESRIMRERMKEIKSMVGSARKALNLLPKLGGILT